MSQGRVTSKRNGDRPEGGAEAEQAPQTKESVVMRDCVLCHIYLLSLL